MIDLNVLEAFKALANESRLAIFEHIREESRLYTAQGFEMGCNNDPETGCIARLAQEFGLAPSTISRHLKELTRARLVITKRQGQWISCSVNEDAVRVLAQYLAPSFPAEQGALLSANGTCEPLPAKNTMGLPIPRQRSKASPLLHPENGGNEER